MVAAPSAPRGRRPEAIPARNRLPKVELTSVHHQTRLPCSKICLSARRDAATPSPFVDNRDRCYSDRMVMGSSTRPEYDRRYAALFDRFCSSEEPASLTEAVVAFCRELITAGVSAMDIKGIHDAVVDDVTDPDDPRAVAAHRLLLEMLFAYGSEFSALSERLLADADAAEQAGIEGAERAEETRLTLLASVSHELGNPLMVVKVNVASIRKFLEERDSWPEALDQREADVAFAVDRMIALREELLAASRNEQRELEITGLPLIHVLRRVVRWGELNASEKSIQVTVDCQPALPYVMADVGALQSILTNLLSNAIRYTPQGGAVDITAKQERDQVVVEVTDNGIGISEEDQLRIYERFYRTDEAKKSTSLGVGLGLAITRDLMSSLGGTVDVRSKVGVGSTFRIALPVAPAAETPETDHPHSSR